MANTRELEGQLKSNIQTPGDGHVFYFEPNDSDLGTDQDGRVVPLAPHVEDMCISMSLIADIYPRKKTAISKLNNDGVNPTVVQKKLCWISYINQDGGEMMQSSAQLVNKGETYNKENYLTTYYTEISADKYIENEIVEGLGITNVNISFESWYTPTITINFVDVHGSALWGREEAIHQSGEITADNILGVFFTQPYPLFRLQVKGFLGQAVTYQLSVSGFKGRYNSQTGNFEATATFIGYSYSLLSDIPLDILSAIAESPYVGRRYWEERVDSKAWELTNANGDGSRQPIPLFVLIENIRSAIGSLEAMQTRDCDSVEIKQYGVDGNGQTKNAVEADQMVSLSAAGMVTNASGSNSLLSKVATAYNDFLAQCKWFAENTWKGRYIIGHSYEGNETKGQEQQIFLLMKSTYNGTNEYHEHTANVNLSKTYVSFCNAIKEYNDAYPSSKFENYIETHNKPLHDRLINGQNKLTLRAKRIYTLIESEGKTQAILANKLDDEKHFQFGTQNIKIFYDVADKLKAIREDYNNNNTRDVKIGDYCVLIPLGAMGATLSAMLQEINQNADNVNTATEEKSAAQSSSCQSTSKNERDKWVEETLNKNIKDIVGFEPTIGNFVKLLMCHLETFVEMMFVCAETIYKDSDKRTLSNLGLNNLDETDIPSNNSTSRKTTDDKKPETIFPWPALYNPHDTADKSENKDKLGNTLGWPNDYAKGAKIEWEEQKVVQAVMEGLARQDEYLKTKYNNKVSNTYTSIPMCGSDLSHLSSPFDEVGSSCKDIEHIASYLGMRMAQSIGMADYKCGAEVAEAIGYVDAINLIKSYYKPKNLQDATQPKNGDTDFATYVLNYITCSNKHQASETAESGKEYNIFETASKGTFYSNGQQRHPMYVKENNGYKYTYAYMAQSDKGTPVSLVPTNLMRFNTGSNPYAVILSPSYESGTLYYNPTVSTTSDNQWWVYSAKSSSSTPTCEVSQEDYTNRQLFTITTDPTVVESLIGQIKSLKEGTIKVNEYTVKGANDDKKIATFINRRYKLDMSSYGDFYFINDSHNYHVVSPTLSSVDTDYGEKHICLTTDKVSDVTFDDKWTTTVGKDTLYSDKLTLYRDGGEFGFKNKNKSIPIEDVFVSELPMKLNGDIISLFGSKLYYSQNDTKDGELALLSKTYLIVSSFMSGISMPNTNEDLFKCDSNSFIKLYPPFYILFLGAILWRNSLEGNKDINWCNDTLTHYPSKEETLIAKDNNILSINTNSTLTWKKIEDFYMKPDDIDIVVKNRLISFFKEMSKSKVMQYIIDNCELHNKDGNVINTLIFESLKTSWNDKSKFDKSSPSQWQQIFNDIIGKYESVSVTTSGQLRLLFNESGTAQSYLRYLYGLTSQYIISRATTERIGVGDRREIVIPEATMKAYLKGFKERIDDLKETSDQKSTEAPTSSTKSIDRDIAVNIYYSLKHIWDAWLITAARDQFTIEEFFDKYFIFMDSFYSNTYNKIKINCEIINRMYSTQNQNLLTFITNTTSEHGCMFFALPDFIDSNIYGTKKNYRQKGDFTWKKSNLAKIFTPIPYNEMNPPQVQNVFVFIYTHKFSDNALENTEKKWDGYDMNNEATWPRDFSLKDGILQLKSGVGGGDSIITAKEIGAEQASPNNRFTDDEDQLISSRYSYALPCFGVTVNRGNNHIFKSINVNMDSPKITAIAAQTWSDILTKTGADGSKRIFFHGQDIFSIYSQYAYACEIEMMGCAQIQPLMYFQLLNIPMWRGTYMIYKVTHTLSPGNMITKFTGMKMSRYQAPFADGYFTIGKRSTHDNINGDNNGSNGSTGTYAGQGAIGGDDMIKAIFGKYTGYSMPTEKGVFGYYRGSNHWHAGADIAAPEGTPLYAPWDGTITLAENTTKAQGNWIHLTDSTGQNMVIYMHCQKLVRQKGDSVKAGDLMAYVGKTGHSATNKLAMGSHLHLELYINGNLNCSGELKSKAKNGTRDAVDPLQNYGGLAVSSTNTTYEAGTETANGGIISGQNTSNSKGSSTNNVNALDAYIIGDSWAKVMGEKKYFKHSDGYTKNGATRQDIINFFNKIPLDKTGFEPRKKVVLFYLSSPYYLGYPNRPLLSPAMVGGMDYINMVNTALWMRKDISLYICTIPTNLTGGTNNYLDNTSIGWINQSIQMLSGKCSIINIPNSVTTNNLKNGYLLKDYSEVLNIIENAIK